MNRILLTAEEMAADGVASLSGRRAAHILNVLKAVSGDAVRVGIINGPLGTGIVEEMGVDHVQLRLSLDSPPPRSHIDLLLAVPRPKVMRRLWAPLASMGVGRIVLTNAAKVQREYFDTHWLQRETYEPRLIEGLEQSGDTWIPDVSIRRRLKPFVEDELDGMFPRSLQLLAHPRDGRQVTDSRAFPEQRILLAVGPEGGWSDFEINLLEHHGFETVSLGSRTLRTDVACIALLALAHEVKRV